MILVAVIVGYILGVMPFIVPKILEKKEEQIELKKDEEEYKTQKEIFDEWLNGAKENRNENKVNQEDIYKEYITGQETAKGD